MFLIFSPSKAMDIMGSTNDSLVVFTFEMKHAFVSH